MEQLNISVLSKRSALSDPLPGTARVYVGRPSPLGNPFAMAKESDRAQVVRDYRDWLRQRYSERGPERAELERLLQLAQAGPLELVCWCAPRACHADVIAEALHGMAKARAQHPAPLE
jgi:hypothetical protein